MPAFREKYPLTSQTRPDQPASPRHVSLLLAAAAARMPRDELGLDPYQASAVSCAKKGAIGSAALALCAIGLMIYGTSGGAGETYTYLGMGAFAGAVVSFCLANRWALAPRLLLTATPSAVLSALARVAVQVTQQGGHPLGRRLLS